MHGLYATRGPHASAAARVSALSRRVLALLAIPACAPAIAYFGLVGMPQRTAAEALWLLPVLVAGLVVIAIRRSAGGPATAKDSASG